MVLVLCFIAVLQPVVFAKAFTCQVLCQVLGSLFMHVLVGSCAARSRHCFCLFRILELLSKHCYLYASWLLMESPAVVLQRCRCMSPSVNNFKRVYTVSQRLTLFHLPAVPLSTLVSCLMPVQPAQQAVAAQQPKVLLSSTSSALLLAAPAPATARRRVRAARCYRLVNLIPSQCIGSWKLC